MESTGGQNATQNNGARREQLLRAALEVIVARGYADTRIADVAEHAGTSPALVIYYFKTRDQLLTEALRYSEDGWYAAGTKRLAAIGTAVGRLTELIAMTCLPDTDPAARSEWLLWLDLWALSPRNAGVAAVRCKFDERWRETISGTVQSGQESGEFDASADAESFAITLSALLDGMAVQIALEDPDVPPSRAYDLAMRYAAGQLGFTWDPAASTIGRASAGSTERAAKTSAGRTERTPKAGAGSTERPKASQRRS
jgi:AcrR family transcriptional regulator